MTQSLFYNSNIFCIKVNKDKIYTDIVIKTPFWMDSTYISRYINYINIYFKNYQYNKINIRFSKYKNFKKFIIRLSL